MGDEQVDGSFAGSDGYRLRGRGTVAYCIPCAPCTVELARVGGEREDRLHHHGRTSFRLQLSVINADGSAERRLAYLGPWVAQRAHFLASRPAWSPDGRSIAYVGVRDDGNLDIYVVRVDGRGRRRLTRVPAADGSPVWSPDGRKIAFTRQEGFYEFDIYVMNADGSGQRRLTRNGWLHFSVAWSPDGRKMLFERPDFPRTDAEELWIMNADGSGQRRLTRNPARDGSPVLVARRASHCLRAGMEERTPGDLRHERRRQREAESDTDSFVLRPGVVARRAKDRLLQ